MNEAPEAAGAQPAYLALLLGSDEPSQAQWEALLARQNGENEALADELKAELDRTVRRDPPAALVLAERLERLTRGLPERRVLGLRGRAVAFHANGRSAEAIVDYRAAVELYDAADEALEAARVRRSLVDVLQMSGNSDAALVEAARARRVFEARGEERLLAQLECNVGNVYFRLDRYMEASDSYRSAIARFERIDDALGRAFALINLGNVETNANDFDAAQHSFADAERVFAEHDHQILAAEARYGLAYLAFRRGDFAGAEAGLRASRAEFEALGKASGPPLCDMDLAELHLRLDAWRDARDRAEAAALRFEELGMDYEQARSTLFAGVAHARLSATDEAERALAAAARLFAQLGNRVLGALVAIHRAELHAGTARSPALAAALVQARDDLAASGDRFLTDLGELALARSRVGIGQLDDARSALEALLERRGGRLPLQSLVEIEAWTALAEVHRHAGDGPAQEVALEHAIEAGEDAFARLSIGDARLAFFRERQPAITRLVATRLERLGSGYAREAVEELDRSRQRSLDEADARRFPPTPALRAARARLNALLCRQLDASTGASAEPSRGPATDLSAELLRAQDELMALVRGLDPEPTSAQPVIRGIEVAPLDAVPKGDALLYYVLDGDDVFVVFGDPLQIGDLGARKLDCSGHDLELLAAGLRFQIGKLRLGAEYAARHARALERSAAALLDRIGQLLLEPAAEALDGRPVTIVPIGVLHELPIHAATFDGRPLIAGCDVSYARSLRQLARLRSPRAVDGHWLACFSPEADLPAIAREREALSASLGARLEPREPDDLLEALTAKPCRLRALHLASHGAFQPDHPLFSGLRLGDRYLTALDLRPLELECEVATLSGCETGRMGRSRSDELHGPAPALLAAGARSVVSSLWPVIDADSAELMDDLYRGLAQGQPVREAYGTAVRERIVGGSRALAWAAFVLAGDPLARPGA
ncbi:CHAT domain-containing tetratricopeptide repeat protein [Engelhardtia mirabilis]|uniref:CHAT domain protein n=1 Tax=Engelhardtia mirabilis TaxID=2528011 RepID=A0A518BRB1_9BACT|nr:CHAT domain protein [Planctomycetes bacterium Pla133]QDV03843.1 CHAT domain protein [Planctomycetes bacterium Pla86]